MSGLFGSADPPAPKPPAPMPDDQSPAVLDAKRSATERILSRAGRSATILTKPENRGGSMDTYASKTLGGAG